MLKRVNKWKKTNITFAIVLGIPSLFVLFFNYDNPEIAVPWLIMFVFIFIFYIIIISLIDRVFYKPTKGKTNKDLEDKANKDLEDLDLDL